MKLIVTILKLLLLTTPIFAQLSPGDLHKSHAHLEGIKNCVKCHELRNKVSRQKCLDCHIILKERIINGRGLHADKKHEQCINCHVEHNGRDFALIYWEKGKENFNHDLTGYKLEGKHAQQKCENCHKPEFIVNKNRLRKQKKDLKKTFLGLSQNCLSCHIDEHRGQLSKTCLECHDYEDWKSASKFSHDRTNFRLTGKHKNVKCTKCHRLITDNKFPDNADYLKFVNLKFQNCTDCHVDVHKNKFGQHCQSCHNTSGWHSYNKSKFNHDLTKYPLRGRHANVECEKCHLPGKPLRIAKFSQCRDCHEDYHRGQFSLRTQEKPCDDCHTVNGFSPSKFTIAGHEKTKYPLNGSHLAVPCIGCHKKIRIGTRETIQFKFNSFRCETCHENPHREEVEKYLKKEGCKFCHQEQSWHISTFDHNKTKFPLEGKHARVECKKCHKPIQPKKYPTYFQFKNVIKLCQNCHEDVHQGQFRDEEIFTRTGKNYTRCERCHKPVDWLAEKFDHDRDSKFKLEGKHKDVPCEKCHSKKYIQGKEVVIYKSLATDCKSCHKKY